MDAQVKLAHNTGSLEGISVNKGPVLWEYLPESELNINSQLIEMNIKLLNKYRGNE